MTRNHRAAFNRLKKMGCPVFERADKPNTFCISAEQNGSDGNLWADFYDGQYSPSIYDDFGVDRRIESVLKPLNLFAEWENPGSLSVWEC